MRNIRYIIRNNTNSVYNDVWETIKYNIGRRPGQVVDTDVRIYVDVNIRNNVRWRLMSHSDNDIKSKTTSNIKIFGKLK